jgi:hypothetical protein
LVAAGLALTGCASQPTGPGDAYRATSDVNYAASAWREQGDYASAVGGLERALEDYSGDTFEQSTLTVLALVHLEHGNREAFLDTAERLEARIGNREYIPQETQFVMTVAAAMNEEPRSELPGRGYDAAMGRSVYGLLQVKE